jgi:hypothetical protein
MLMSGDRSVDKQGADIVISDMNDLFKLVNFFKEQRAAGAHRPFAFPEQLLSSLAQPVWVNSKKL